MPPSYDDILCAAISSLAKRAKELDHEQAVRGIDSLTELQLHALIDDAFTESNFGVHREAHYPSDGDAYTKPTHRQRCDFVLTPNPTMKLIDPALELKELALAQDTLFAGVTIPERDPASTCPPSDACWVEVKAAAQHAYRDGIPSPNQRYGLELVNGLQTDLCKLAADPEIWHGCVLAILFTESEEIAKHDLNQAASICIDQGLPVRSPIVSCESITERAGNSCVSVGIFAVAI